MSKKETEEIVIALTELKKDTEYLRERIDKINGSLNDCPANKEKLKIVCDDMREVKPIVSNLRIKIYGIAAAIGVVSGGIMGTIGIFIGKAIGS